MHPYNSTDTTTAGKKSHFILLQRSDFRMIDNQTIVVNAFPLHMLTLFSVDEILLPRSVN